MRFEAPFFMKFYFYQPFKINREKNSKHISYIAERPGVDKTFTSDQEALHDEAANHVLYAHQRPGSHGLFSSDGYPNPKNIQNDLLNHKGIVWRGHFSLTENDAVRLGFDKKSNWERLLRSNMPLIASEMKIKLKDFRWVAAFHAEKGHPHVHFVIWDQSNKRNRGKLTSKERMSIRKTIMKDIYADERIRLAQEKTAMRDLIRQLAKDDLVKSAQLVKEIRQHQNVVDLELGAIGGGLYSDIAPKSSALLEKELADKLLELSKVIPKSGRLVYQYMSSEVKMEIDKISSWLLVQPGMKQNYKKYLDSVEAMSRPYSTQSEQIEDAKMKASNDLKKRLGQIIIRAAVETTKYNYPLIDQEKALIAFEMLRHGSESPLSKDDVIIFKTATALRCLGVNHTDSQNALKEWYSQSDAQLSFEKLSEKLNLQVNTSPTAEKDEMVKALHLLKVCGWEQSELINLIYENNSISAEDKTALLGSIHEELITSKDYSVSETAWKTFCESIQADLKCPWETVEVVGVEETTRQEFIEELRNSVSDNIDEHNLGWAIYSMTVGLKSMSFSSDECLFAIKDWLRGNGLYINVDEIIDKVFEDKTSILRKSTWKNLQEFFGFESLYPWKTHTVTEFNHEIANEVVPQIESHVKDPDENSMIIYHNVLMSLDLPREEIENKFSKLNWNIPNIERIQQFKAFEKMFTEKCDLKETVITFTKTLAAIGMNSNEIVPFIRDWADRSTANVSDVQIKSWVKTAMSQIQDNREWGRDAFVGRKDFERFARAIGKPLPYMWQNNRDYQSQLNRQNIAIAASLWKSLWVGLEQERKQAEAKVEWNRRMQQQQSRQRNREQDHEL